jgi:hypothetical protein
MNRPHEMPSELTDQDLDRVSGGGSETGGYRHIRQAAITVGRWFGQDAGNWGTQRGSSGSW